MVGRRIAIAVLESLVVGVLLGCSSGDGFQLTNHLDRTPPNVGRWTLEEAHSFSKFPLYWVGPEFAGLELDTIYRLYTPDARYPEDAVVFIYGTCKPQGGLFGDGGCAPPLQIRVESLCEERLHSLGQGNEQPAPTLRGGAELRDTGPEGALYVWTGAASVRISGEPNLREQVARSLVSINALGPLGAGDPLPPPGLCE